MSNPFVVFLDPDRKVWKCPVPLPTGWKPDGRPGDPTTEACEFRIVVLHDRRAIPNTVHTNKAPGLPLIVLRHANSELNANPEGNGRLQQWGTPRVVASFQHESNNPRFVLIRQLFDGLLTATAFAASFANEAEAAALLKIAAICQMAILDPSMVSRQDWAAEVHPIEKAALANIAMGTTREYKNLVDSSGVARWRDRLHLVAMRARDLRQQ